MRGSPQITTRHVSERTFDGAVSFDVMSLEKVKFTLRTAARNFRKVKGEPVNEEWIGRVCLINCISIFGLKTMVANSRPQVIWSLVLPEEKSIIMRRAVMEHSSLPSAVR